MDGHTSSPSVIPAIFRNDPAREKQSATSPVLSKRQVLRGFQAAGHSEPSCSDWSRRQDWGAGALHTLPCRTDAEAARECREGTRDRDICPRSPHWQGLEPGSTLGMGRGAWLCRPRSKACEGHAWALTQARPHPVWSAQAPSQGGSTQVRGRQQVVTL